MIEDTSMFFVRIVELTKLLVGVLLVWKKVGYLNSKLIRKMSFLFLFTWLHFSLYILTLVIYASATIFYSILTHSTI